RRALWGLKPEDVKAFLDEVAEALDEAQKKNFEMGTQVRLLQEKIQTLTNTQASASPSAPCHEAKLLVTSNRGTDGRGAQGCEAERNDVSTVRRLEALRTATLQEVEALLHDAQTRAQEISDAASERADVILREAEMLKSEGKQQAEELISGAKGAAESITAAARDEEAAVRHQIERLADRRVKLVDDLRKTLELCNEWLGTVDPRQRAANAGAQSAFSEPDNDGRAGVDGMKSPAA